VGSELVSDSSPREGGESSDFATLSYTEVFYQHLPFYLAIGMPEDTYFNGDCVLVRMYRQANELRQRRHNQDLWLQGMYIYEALCDVSPVLHAFAKKGTKPLPYPKEPYALTDKERNERTERDEKIRYEKIKAMMSGWASKSNAQFKSNAGKEVNGG